MPILSHKVQGLSLNVLYSEELVSPFKEGGRKKRKRRSSGGEEVEERREEGETEGGGRDRGRKRNLHPTMMCSSLTLNNTETQTHSDGSRGYTGGSYTPGTKCFKMRCLMENKNH